MITMVVQLRVPPQHAPAFEALMQGVCDRVRAEEPGVLHYGFARSADDPNVYAVIEVYRDATAHAAHMATDWVLASFRQTLPLIEGRPDIKQFVTPGTEPVVLRTGKD